ncbi:BgTH12-06400 [Blumeria graminis f. sp. triticale]|uniref:BgTH12-06400 n=1 Tax=Blumeria graminis f. sp. triticale TaxID=1689686 RepID=A0A9W4GCN4_BLUGR|nr:BgTH12-06400 [Blumeria graminis f. sp. triticale]
MIRCAVAFLLISGRRWNRLDRLVVTTDEVDKPSYGVYEVKSRDHFPHPKSIDEFMLSRTEITEKGTYYMPYCSDHFDSSEIAGIITKGLTDITHRAHVNLTHDPKMERSCLKSLASISNPKLEQNVIDISKGIIAVDGPYKAFVPRIADQTIVVTHDQPMDMKSLVLNGEIFARSSTGLEQNALAWYQGHLHLFKQNMETNQWSPVTLVGSEVRNGSLITEHILGVLPDLTWPWRAIDRAQKADIGRQSSEWEETHINSHQCSLEHCHKPDHSTFSAEMQTKYPVGKTRSNTNWVPSRSQLSVTKSVNNVN